MNTGGHRLRWHIKEVSMNSNVIMRRALFQIIFASLLISGCGQSQPPAPTITPTLVPTLTLTPTFTPEPTITPTFTPTPSMGSTMVSEKDGMVLVFVPAGEFTMGSKLYASERPPHQVNLSAYWVDQTVVTNEMFVAFLNDVVSQTLVDSGNYVRFKDNVIYALTCIGCTRWTDRIVWDGVKFSSAPGYENHPVLLVTWAGADAYCSWAGRRLPTEAEWEKAARGTDARTYPWGEASPDDSLLNFADKVGDTTEVGKYPDGVSVYGALDMSGNAWEWVSDWYGETYYQSSPSTDPLGPDSGDHKVARGNGWYDIFNDVRSAYRSSLFPNTAFDNLGFRCARSQ